MHITRLQTEQSFGTGKDLTQKNDMGYLLDITPFQRITSYSTKERIWLNNSLNDLSHVSNL